MMMELASVNLKCTYFCPYHFPLQIYDKCNISFPEILKHNQRCYCTCRTALAFNDGFLLVVLMLLELLSIF